MDRTKIIAGLIALLLGGCSRPARIAVGSKNFTEQVLLGEIVAQQIERKLGVAVERRLDLGGTMLAHEALVHGSIDVYPEYTGTALTAVLKEHPVSDPPAALARVRAGYRKWKLSWLDPLGFENTFAMVIRGADAREGHLATLSDAAKARAWRLGTGYEFRQRPDGLAGLLRTYGLRMEGDPVAMDLGLLYAALEKHRVDLIAANSTDGLLSVLDATVLHDDRRYFPPYQCAFVVRDAALERFPGLRGALEELSGRLSDETMRSLNYQVDGQHRSPHDVARGFLTGLYPGRR